MGMRSKEVEHFDCYIGFAGFCKGVAEEGQLGETLTVKTSSMALEEGLGVTRQLAEEEIVDALGGSRVVVDGTRVVVEKLTTSADGLL